MQQLTQGKPTLGFKGNLLVLLYFFPHSIPTKYYIYILINFYISCSIFKFLLSCFYSNLVQSILQVSLHFKDDPSVTQALNKIANSLQETIKYHSILIDQAGRSVSRSLNNFLKKYTSYQTRIDCKVLDI